MGHIPIARLRNLVDDLTPQLGGDLDVNGFSIISTSNGNVVISPDGTGVLIVNSDLRLDGDAYKLVLGEEQDASLYYDGTDVILTTDLQNASDFVVDCGTNKTLELTESVWDDLRIPVTSGRIGASNPPTLTQFKDDGSGSVGVFTFAFADQANANNEEQLWFAVQLPHAWKLGTNIEPHLHWGLLVGGGANEFVKWGLEYTWQNVNGDFSDTTIITSDASQASTATTSGDSTLTADKHYITDLGSLDGTGKNLSSMLLCRLFRNSSHADDDLAQAAFVFEVDFHYEINTVGSRQPFIK